MGKKVNGDIFPIPYDLPNDALEETPFFLHRTLVDARSEGFDHLLIKSKLLIGKPMLGGEFFQFDITFLHCIDLSIQSQKLYHFIEQNLEPREQKILTYRYGLYNVRPLPQREVAKKLDISRSYV